jgi:hypothetical protein
MGLHYSGYPSLTHKYSTMVEVDFSRNTLAYYDTAPITAAKSLKVQAQELS